MTIAAITDMDVFARVAGRFTGVPAASGAFLDWPEGLALPALAALSAADQAA